MAYQRHKPVKPLWTHYTLADTDSIMQQHNLNKCPNSPRVKYETSQQSKRQRTKKVEHRQGRLLLKNSCRLPLRYLEPDVARPWNCVRTRTDGNAHASLLTDIDYR